MTKEMRLLASASALAVAMLGFSPAIAADLGTDAGTDIINSATVNYSVGGVTQTPASGTADSFKVDRKVNLLVATSDASWVTVAPGQALAATTFTVRNLTNETLDFSLVAANLANGTVAPHTGTDSFDLTPATLKVYADTNTNGVFDSGTDLEITYIDNLAEDTSQTVFVVGAIPGATVTDNIAVVSLKATAHAAATSGTLGAALVQTTGANTAGVDNVFADTTAGSDDVVRTGDHSARSDYKVAAANLTVTKTSTVISDPINGTTLPKMIPGATVQYCVVVSNAAGSATATGVEVKDTLPATTDFVAGTIMVDGDASCASGSAGGSFAGGIVTAPLSAIAAGVSRSARFRVTVK